jgi:hypothetical protein
MRERKRLRSVSGQPGYIATHRHRCVCVRERERERERGMEKRKEKRDEMDKRKKSEYGEERAPPWSVLVIAKKTVSASPCHPKCAIRIPSVFAVRQHRFHVMVK